MLSLSNMCKMRNKHLKQLKGREGTAKKTLVEKKKIKFKPSATRIAKEQETEPSSTHSTGATMENPAGEGREGASTNTGASPAEPPWEQGCGQPSTSQGWLGQAL